MRKNLLSVLLVFFITASSLVADDRSDSPQVRYIEEYASLAVEEMYRSGVPASITLAQGLLESGYGLSELAVKGNNHFGIKCHNNWQGGKVYHDDDRKGECFRKYDSPEESFRDHSDFLRYRDRYKFLFDLETTDYKGWAYGLKKAGYATDPAYPSKLIRLIEDYSLYRYDVVPYDYSEYDIDDVEEYVARREKRAEKRRKKGRHVPEETVTVPESPTKIEAIKLIEAHDGGEFRFILSRQMYSLNGVPFVYSSKGESYLSIAKAFGLFPKEILKYNDLSYSTDIDAELVPGTLIYIQPKKKEAAEGIEKHVIEEGDTLWALSQRYGVKLSRIYKMNMLDEFSILREGDIIRLRK